MHPRRGSDTEASDAQAALLKGRATSWPFFAAPETFRARRVRRAIGICHSHVSPLYSHPLTPSLTHRSTHTPHTAHRTPHTRQHALLPHLPSLRLPRPSHLHTLPPSPTLSLPPSLSHPSPFTFLKNIVRRGDTRKTSSPAATTSKPAEKRRASDLLQIQNAHRVSPLLLAAPPPPPVNPPSQTEPSGTPGRETEKETVHKRRHKTHES